MAKRRRRRAIVVVVGCMLVPGTGLACGGSGEKKASTTADEQTIEFQQPEDPGPEPFAPPADVGGRAKVALPPSGSGGGKQPFGGSGSNRVCDRDKLIRFLRSHPQQRQEFARVLGIDPSQSSVEKYIASLHPVTLTRDTQVTNHAFRNGRAVPFQAILQSGTAVLVDKHGTPVVRCYCGNPLGPPVVVKTAKCHGCPPNYRPPKQCTYGRQDDYDKTIYRRKHYSNGDYDEEYIRRHRSGPYEDCYTAYPEPPVVTIVDVYEPEPEPEPPPEQPSQPPPPPQSDICNDGIDNEGVPGRVDEDDPRCGGPPEDPPRQPPEQPAQPSPPPQSGICNDGIDNEGVPGQIDGDDPNCQ